MTLINIGELANHLSEYVAAQSRIPFRQIVGLRNRAAHGYLVLNFQMIWATVQDSIPTLKEEVLRLIDLLSTG